MRTGIYRKVEGHTGVGMFYQFLLLMREHTTGEEAVAYIPLRVEAEWAGTVRPCYLPRAAFEQKFVYVGEGLPRYPGDLGHADDQDGASFHHEGASTVSWGDTREKSE